MALRLSWLVISGIIAAGGFASQIAAGAVGDPTGDQVAAASAAPILDSTTEVELHFIQEDGPQSGHVRVILTPETRPLTILEARAAAQQAFLTALDEPGLGGPLSRITVVVRLMPASHPISDAAEQVIQFRHKGGRNWAVIPGE